MGETKISWLKSFSRSSMRLMTPIAADCQSVWARTPVKTKVRRSKRVTFPNPACRLVPSTPMKMSGNVKSAMSRVRSRRSLTRSRCAIARTAESSCIGLAHDLEIRVLQGRHVRLHHAERGVDRFQDRVGRAAIQLDAERSLAGVGHAQPFELGTQLRPVC